MNLRFFIAEAISNAGTGIGFSVLGLLLAKSGEAQALALLGALGHLAQPLGLYTGLLVDRVSPRKLVLMAKLGEGFVWAVMFAFPHSAYAMLGLAFAAIVFHDLAYNTLNAALTRSLREELVEQTARFQNAWLSGSLAGTAIGPGLHELIGRNTYGLAALLLLAGAVLLATWSLWGRVGGPAPTDRGNRGGLLEGFRIISKERTLRSFVGLGLLVVFAFSFSRALDPMIALELKVPPELLGVFLVAASLGQISGNAIGARLGAARSLTFGLGLASTGCLALAFSPHPYALITQFVRLGGFTLALLGLRAFRQWCMPRASLGRTLASLNILNGAAGVAGAAAAGVVGKFEPLFTLPVAALLAACALAWMVFIRPPRRLRQLEEELRQTV